jgi:5'-nucleotidase
MKRILIDMDDVMADTGQKVIDMINEQQNGSFNKQNLSSDVGLYKQFEQHYMNFRPQLFEKGFFLDIPVMEDAQEVVKKLHEKYEIFVVSAANEFPLSLAEKLEWLDKYFPFIGWKYTVFCGHKWMIQADFIIDDHPKNLTNFKGHGLMFDAIHNQEVVGYQRVHSWKEIEGILL